MLRRYLSLGEECDRADGSTGGKIKRERENRGLAELVIDTFNTVKKIHPCPRESTTLRNIQTIYNHYMLSKLTESPVASPVKSPSVNAPIIDPTEGVEKVSIPKKMKKAFRRNS